MYSKWYMRFEEYWGLLLTSILIILFILALGSCSQHERSFELTGNTVQDKKINEVVGFIVSDVVYTYSVLIEEK